jgi:hypothetical protein
MAIIVCSGNATSAIFKSGTFRRIVPLDCIALDKDVV